MNVHHNGKFLVRIPQHQFAVLHSQQFNPATLEAVVGSGVTEPLFQSTYQAPGSNPFQIMGSYAAGRNWVLHSPNSEQNPHPWDAAHELARRLVNGTVTQAAMPDAYVEPDLARETNSPVRSAESFTEAAITPSGPPYLPRPGATGALDPHYTPKEGTQFALNWHLLAGKFPDAWTKTKGAGVRIAHLDTGYWPDHYSTPAHMRQDLGKNFYDGPNDDVIDPGTELTAGHGTATLALLAGKTVSLTSPNATPPVYEGFIGGAPEAEILPVRIGGIKGSVVHFYGSTMARGLEYALTPADGNPSDVISLSHGGLPSNAWADAINRLYDAGVVVVAASGDSFDLKLIDIASHFTVYPSAFWRVITATGVTFDHKPYKNGTIGVMQGCWGPTAVMHKAVAACTPNVPHMAYKTHFDWDMNGNGTSASTPQIAAACALWLAQYGSQMPSGWQRVAACRHALFHSVAGREENIEEIGVGRLDVSAMLDEGLAQEIVAMAKSHKLPYIEPDRVSWPFFRLLFGLPPVGDGIDEMYEVEALQLLYRSKDKIINDLIEQGMNRGNLSSGQLDDIRQRFIAHPVMSQALRDYLTRHMQANLMPAFLPASPTGSTP